MGEIMGRWSPFWIIFVLGEALIMAGGTILAVYLRLGTSAELFTWKYSWHRLVLVPLVLQITFYYSDLHDFRVSRPFSWTVARAAEAMAVGSLTLAVIYYIMPRLFLGRGVLLLSYFLILILVLMWRGVYTWALARRLFALRLVVLGAGSLADSIIEEILCRADNIYQVICLVDLSRQAGQGRRADDPAPEEPPLNLMPYWATLLRAELRTDAGELAGLVRYFRADMVVVAIDEKRGVMPMEELLRCRMLGVPIISGEDFFEQISGRILANRVRTSWLVFSPGFHTGTFRRLSKRAGDALVAALGLLICLPLFLLTALAVRLDSKGPVIYRQERVGQYDRIFTIYKFRSMVDNAEEESGPVWAARADSRVTRVGRIIRQTRLDEVPQLWNVLKGDMSFVGPRPERPHFVEELSQKLPFYRERHNVKPGITGWAQVSYPYGSSLEASLEKLNFDLYYIKHSNLALDVIIFIKTVKTILFGQGGR
ncbi:MAG: TIGR03013 family PEP-CTERM/XrtA system glycosyltransferase [Deltaproteobacteria bacterium]|nr:TIGR03013 family PEP-CTERM/XrtA system glycosyltransferase [Deltaproteobacteria bacterium]